MKTEPVELPFGPSMGEALRSFAQEHAIPLVFGLCGVLVLQSVRLWWVRTASARRLGRHKRLGADGERRARVLLEKLGYRLCAEQEGGSYLLNVDGHETPIFLRADYLVERKGQRYVAEVKSGAESAKVTGRATRRQLLEYLFAFDVEGVLLVDMQAKTVKRVSFPGFRGQ